jgi:ribosomal protein L11 methyltransferase
LKWLRVSITLSGELAEPVSDLLSQHASGGIAIEPLPRPQIPNKSSDVTLNAFLPADDELDVRRKAIEEGLWHLSQIQQIPRPTFTFIEEEDWGKAWKDHYHPIRVGERLVIQPAWIPLDETDRIPLLMDPGMAFGTGTHPTTQLCLEALEKNLQNGQSVIDLGCGSGILSIAAAKLGASRVLALDIDPIAVRNTLKNSQRNDVSHLITVHQGSLDYLLAEAPLEGVPATIVVVNILAKTIEQMLRTGLEKVIKEEGLLILSGILDDQVKGIQSRCDEIGFSLVETMLVEDWRALIFKRMPPLDLRTA